MYTTDKANTIRGLNILHKAFCIGCSLIMILLYFFVSHESTGFGAKIDILGMAALVLAATATLLSGFMFKKQTLNLGKLTEENAESWRGAYIMKWALLEGPVLFCTMIYFFAEPNPVLLVVALLILLYLYTQGPKFD